jgi:hypothetical protein
MRTSSTGQPHALSANGGFLRLEEFRYAAVGNNKRGIKGEGRLDRHDNFSQQGVG